MAGSRKWQFKCSPFSWTNEVQGSIDFVTRKAEKKTCFSWDSAKCGCGRRMRTADADGGRRTADGGRRTADGGRRTADGGRPDTDKINNKNQKNFKKDINKYKNKNFQLIIRKRKNMSKHPRKLVVYIKKKNSHAALRLFWRLVNHVNQLSVILVIISPCHMYWSWISLPALAIRRSVLSVCNFFFLYSSTIFLVYKSWHISATIFNNYSPKWRWLVVDIYRAAKRRGKYSTLATDTEVNSCFSIY